MAKILVIDKSPVIQRLLAIMLGGRHHNGFLLMQRFQSLPRLAIVPIIAVSGNHSPRLKEKALQAGAQAFFTKPPDRAGILCCR